MAARRLIIILIVLMLISTLAAALAPVEDEQPPDEDAIEQPAPETPKRGGDVVEARIDAGEDELPVTIEVAPDTRLALTVGVAEPGLVTIPAFGLTSFTVPEAPASFDLLIREPGTTPVSLDGRTIGRIKAS